MSTLEFVESLVQSLAWPVAVLVMVFMFRVQIARLLTSQMRRVKAGPIEVEWDRQLSEAQVELEQPGVASTDGTAPMGPISEELESVARVSPAAAVMEAHARVERELRRLLQEAGAAEADLKAGAAGLARSAVKRGLVTEETARAVEGISILRNLAAHGHAEEVSQERAMDYLVLVDAVLYAIGERPR